MGESYTHWSARPVYRRLQSALRHRYLNTSALQTDVDNILAEQHRNIIIAADFNFHGWNWNTNQLKQGCPLPKPS